MVRDSVTVTRGGLRLPWLLTTMLSTLCLGCGAAPALSEQDTVSDYVAAATTSNLQALRALMAYVPDADSSNVVIGSQIPIACARIEQGKLRAARIDADAPARLTQVTPPLTGARATTLDVAFLPLHNGAELGRQLISVHGNWYVLAESNDVCDEHFSE